jgi:hypothetical protein
MHMIGGRHPSESINHLAKLASNFNKSSMRLRGTVAAILAMTQLLFSHRSLSIKKDLLRF